MNMDLPGFSLGFIELFGVCDFYLSEIMSMDLANVCNELMEENQIKQSK